MGLCKEVRPLFTAETAKSKAYRKQERQALSCHATVVFSALSAKQMYSCYITAARASISSHHTSNTLLAVGSASAKCASKCCLFKR